MPANIMFPTNAKITALVCSGRKRPKVRKETPSALIAPKVIHSRNLPFICHQESWVAMTTPTSMPMMPQKMEAIMKRRTDLSS